MALFQASYFTGFSDTCAVPAGSTDVISAGRVDIILSTGVTQQVFDTLSTALKYIHFMETSKLYYLSPNDDIIVLNLKYKLMVLGKVYINQKMMNSCVFTYHVNQVQAIHRPMADMVTLSDALGSVGFRCIGLPWDLDSNPKMEANRADKDRPRIQIVD